MNGQADADGENSMETPEAGRTDEETLAAEESGNEPAKSQDPIAELQAKADENWTATFARRRSSRMFESVPPAMSKTRGNSRWNVSPATSWGVCDSLEMGIAAGSDAGADALLEGSNATLKQLNSTLAQYGVVEVDPLGEPFDPELHEAMTMQPSAEAEPDSVLTVFQKGYTLNGRLLRPARVVVAQAVPDEGE